jgi:ribosome biogenesis protein SSF1/2
LLSETEAEFDGPDNQVELKEELNIRHAVNLKNSTSAIRLYEIGPRMKLKLVKIEEGVCDGEVLYHDSIKKSPEELSEIRENLKSKK